MIRVVLDNNLPPALCDDLRALGVDAVHVGALGLAGATDHEIWAAAVSQARAVMTKDADFARILEQAKPPIVPVILVRVGNVANQRLRPWLIERWTRVEQLINKGSTIVTLGRVDDSSS